MKTLNKLICLFIPAALLLAVFSGCRDIGGRVHDGTVVFTSYRDIPGVTAKEIAEIEALRERFNYFTYGMMLSTEAFIDTDGKINGYAAITCRWLTELFGIPFVPKIFSWEQITEGLNNGEIDFAGTLTATEERRQIYSMTDAIAYRTIKYFRIAGDEPLTEIAKRRLPRYALLKNAVHADNVLRFTALDFEPVFVSEYIEAYYLMKNGKVDALLAEDSAEAIFDDFGDVVITDFYPLLYTPISLTAQNPALAPVVEVVQKALENGGAQYLNELYGKGHQEYLKHKLYTQLTDEEIDYIRNNTVIPFAAEFENYPVSFLSIHDGGRQWHGISHDILRSIEALTGLTFEVVNDEGTDFYELLEMLEDGRAHILSEVIPTEDREGRFIWPAKSFNTEWSVLISKASSPNININRIYVHRAGLTRGSAHTELFHKWFPNHPYTEYANQQAALGALIAGEVDLIIASNSFFLYLTNYLELPDYKATVIINDSFESTFGINKDQHELRSIIDKAMALIDTRTISEQWRQRTYDYRLMLAQAEIKAQRPWLIGTSVLLLCVLIMVFVLLLNKRSEELRLDALVKKRTAEVEAANRAKSAFLSTMSHEIRTPMNAILGITEMQLQRDIIDAETRLAMERIFTSGDLLLSIINDILDLSKIEAGRLELLADKYEIASLISDTAQLNMMRVGSKRIQFELHIDENIPMQMTGDELRVKQIISNLLSNAFKYTSKGTVILSVAFEESRKNDNEVVLVIRVSDTGQGMTKEQLGKLFDEYARFNQETNRSTEGTGLGMSITKNLIRLMGGDISVESELGKGSTFTVHLPQGRGNSDILGKEMAENLRLFRTSNRAQMRRAQITREPMPYGKILIVDDVETNAYVAKGLLTPYELKIESVGSGFAAIEKIRSGKVYDIIFMDHMMPEMDGIEAAKRIREMGYNHPIVALTANAVAGQAGIFLENGFDDFISKPIDLRHMNILLNKMIRDKQPPEVIEAARKDAAARKEQLVLPRQTGDPEFVRVFLREADKSLATLEELTEKDGWHDRDDDLRTYIIHIHTIKSALANIGRLDLSAVALKLEQAVRNKIIEIVISETPGFFHTLKAFLEELKQKGNTADGLAGTSALNRKITGLDITKGLEQANNDEAAYIKILRSYAANARSLLTSIESVDEKKLTAYNRAVHGIKGASYYVFAGQVSHQAEALEKASRAGDFDYVSKQNTVFLETAWKLIGDLNEMLSAYDAENPKPMKPKPERETLLKILEACKRFDMDDLDDAMEEIERYHYESDDGLVDWLREAVYKMNMTQIVDKLTNFEI